MAEGSVERRVLALLACPGGEARSSWVSRLALVTIIGAFVGGWAGRGQTHHLLGLHIEVETILEEVLHAGQAIG